MKLRQSAHQRESGPLVFLHVPKTGGSTLHGILHRQYGRRRCLDVTNKTLSQLPSLTSDDWRRIKVVKGHLGYKVHQWIPTSGGTITLLRDPVRRMVSNYHWILEHEGHYLHQPLVSQCSNIKDYVEKGIHHNINNRHVRLLSGRYDVPFGHCSDDMLRAAINNLDRGIRIAGITELYDESIIFMMLEFGWRYPLYRPLNVAKQPHPELGAETLKAIRARNRLDLKLYGYVRRAFELKLDHATPRFWSCLRRFRRLNRVFQVVARIKDRFSIVPG